MASVENTMSPVDELVAWAQDSGGTLSKAEIEVEQRGCCVLRAVVKEHLDLPS